jgi:pantoate--beta-alanine ligase
MGALHEGHRSLIRAARSDCDVVVVSIFVNPTQFGPGEDFERYPRPFEADRAACEELGVDAVFSPDAAEMYPPGAETYVVQERLTKRLCGASRPAHFRGVLTVVLKLFHIVAPHAAYFGRKDFQQTVVLRRMVKDLDVPVAIRVRPTVREPDGLAVSSRNQYLSPAERRQAACLVHALRLCRDLFEAGERSGERLCDAMRARIEEEAPARIDYLEVVRPDSLEPADPAEAGDVAVGAVYLGATRLIDNMLLGIEPDTT